MNDLAAIKFYKLDTCLEIKKIILTKEDVKYFFFAAEALKITSHIIKDCDFFYVIYFANSKIINESHYLDILYLFKWLKDHKYYKCYSIETTEINNLIDNEVYIVSDKTIDIFLKYFKGARI